MKKIFSFNLIFLGLALFYLLLIPFYSQNGVEFSLLTLRRSPVPPIVKKSVIIVILATIFVIGGMISQIKFGQNPQEIKSFRWAYINLFFNFATGITCLIGADRLNGSPAMMFSIIWEICASILLIFEMTMKPAQIQQTAPSQNLSNATIVNTPTQSHNTQRELVLPNIKKSSTISPLITNIPSDQTIMSQIQAGSEVSNQNTIKPQIHQKHESIIIPKQIKCPECNEYISESLLDRIHKGFDGFCERCGTQIKLK